MPDKDWLLQRGFNEFLDIFSKTLADDGDGDYVELLCKIDDEEGYATGFLLSAVSTNVADDGDGFSSIDRDGKIIVISPDSAEDIDTLIRIVGLREKRGSLDSKEGGSNG